MSEIWRDIVFDTDGVPVAEKMRRQQELEAAKQRGEEPKAKTNVAKSLLVGVLSGAVFGPLAGLLIGGSSGILDKKNRQNSLDMMAERDGAFGEINAIFDAQLDSFVDNARSEDDLLQAEALRTTKNAAMKMIANPTLQTEGAKMLEKFYSDMNEYAVRQETQQIAADIREEEAVRALGQEGYDRYRTSKGNFDTESAPYFAVRQSTENLIGALNRGTAVDQYAAIKLLEKALDPRSVVRPEEQEAWGQLTSLYGQVDVFKERLSTGKSLLPEQVRQLKELAYSIEGKSFEFQQGRETRYADENQDIELPQKYRDNFQIASELEQSVPLLENGQSAVPVDEMSTGELMWYEEYLRSRQ